MRKCAGTGGLELVNRSGVIQQVNYPNTLNKGCSATLVDLRLKYPKGLGGKSDLTPKSPLRGRGDLWTGGLRTSSGRAL